MTSECIDSIIEKTHDLLFEIILIDNASTDGSKEFFSKDSRIRYFYQHSNCGFGIANNIGARYAIGKYLFFLNSDTLLLNNAIKFFIDYQSRCNQDIILGSYLLDRNHCVTHSYSNFLTPKQELFNMFYFPFKKRKEEHESRLNDINVDYITGADLFMSKEAFDKVRGFYPGFFMYFEETDMQYALKRMGYTRKIIQGPQIIHLEGGSSKMRGKRFVINNKKITILKSKILFFKRNFYGVWYWLYRIILPFYMLVFFVTKGDVGSKKKLFKIVFS